MASIEKPASTAPPLHLRDQWDATTRAGYSVILSVADFFLHSSMTIRPHNKMSPVISTLEYEPLWSVCPWVQTDRQILSPKYFLSLDVASQSIYSLFWGTLWPPKFSNFEYYFSHCVPITTRMDFYRGKNNQNLNFPHVKMRKCFLLSFCHIIFRQFASQICS
jgi:hypothetical protein